MSNNKIIKSEATTQLNAIRFFCEELDYKYIGNLKEQTNRNIREEDLTIFLTKNQQHSETIALRAIRDLVEASGNTQNGLYDANKKVYSLLKYGAKVVEKDESQPQTIYFIDFAEPSNNIFSIAEEVTIRENLEKRPDLVIYINGIAIAIIELKRSSVSIEEGIKQNITNQRPMFIQNFFTTIQLVLAANESEGVKYGTIGTKEVDYLIWKNDGFNENSNERDELDVRIETKVDSIGDKLLKGIYALFQKDRLLDIIDNFIIFNKGQKQICRYNQYFGIKRARARLKKGEGGIIWHTQGSGKSLTMVWLSKWIKTFMPDSRVLIITDREELDEQIEKLFKGVGETTVRRTESGNDLINRLDGREDTLICSLIHKFGHRQGDANDSDYDKYIDELKKSLPKNFEAKGNIYVFVDECHRTQSGKLHAAMKTLLPKAIFIGFTGTPLLKKDKKTSLEIFGNYIHVYKYNEGVMDGVVLDLKYEFRNVPQMIQSQEEIDVWFETKTKGLMPKAKAALKEKWANMQMMYSSKSRLEVIVRDIIADFSKKPRLAMGNGNALLVADSIYSACQYYELFISKNFTKCAIITSFIPNVADLRTAATGSEVGEEDAFYKYKVYLKMVGIDPENPPEGSSIQEKVEKFEKEAKRKFIEEPANMKLLIVVDKLLTGFDAHPCTYLYIDKNMQDHGLFQAVCRVNRLDTADKEFGYIVDYKQLFEQLEGAINVYASSDYTKNAFAGFESKDIDGLLNDIKEKSKNVFLNRLNNLENLCEGVEPPKDKIDYEHFFCGENGINVRNDEIYSQRRSSLYLFTNRLIRAYVDFKPYMEEIGYSQEKLKYYEDKVHFYTELKMIIGRSSGDFINLEAYEPEMRYLIDNYVLSIKSQKLGEFEDYTLLDFVKSQGRVLSGESDNKREKENSAELIEYNISKEIVEKKPINPKYYEKMSVLLSELIEQRNKNVIAYKELLTKYLEIIKNVEEPETNPRYSEKIRKSAALMAFYDNFGEDEELAIQLDEAVSTSIVEGFRNNVVKANAVKKKLYGVLNNKDLVEEAYKIIVEQKEY